MKLCNNIPHFQRVPGGVVALSAGLAIALTLGSAPTRAEADAEAEGEVSPPEDRSFFPLYRTWFEEQNITLPLPYGVGAAMVYMERDIEIEDVSVSIGNRPAQSISDRADFKMTNETILGSAKFDAWVLPVMNVYVMLGRTESEARLDSTLMVKPPGESETVPVKLDVKEKVDGPILGVGMTFVAGHKDWFGMLDASYVTSDIDEFDGTMDVWMASARVGRTLGTDFGRTMVWGGLFYVDTQRTLTFSQERPLLGNITVDVEQQTKNPLTYQIGGSLQLSKHWEVLTEIGSNFDDASLLVVSASYRF